MKFLFILSLSLACFINVAYGNKIIDSLENEINKSINHQNKLSLIIELTEHLIKNGLKEALFYTDKALKIADSTNDLASKAKIYLQKGICWRIWGNNSIGIEYLYNALLHYDKNNNIERKAEVLRTIGETYRSAANLTRALEYLYNAKSLFKSAADKAGLARTYNRLAATYYEISFIHDYQLTNDSLTATKFLNVEDLYYLFPEKKDAYDSAIAYIHLSNSIINNSPELASLIVSNDNILASLYNNTLQKDKAIATYKRALDQAERFNLALDIPLILHNIASWYYYQADLDNALAFAKQSFELANQNDLHTYIYMASGLIGLIYERIGEFKKAIEYIKIAYLSRMNYFKNDIQVSMIAFQFENQLKKSEQAVLIQKKQNKVILYSALILALFGSAFIALLIKKNKYEKDINAKLKEKNELISEQKNQLELLNIQKDKFFSIIAHDLRNPIYSFKLTSALLKDDFDNMDNDEKKEIISLLFESSINVTDLLENLLQWSRSQRNKIVFDPINLNLYELINNNFKLLHANAAQKSIKLINNFDNDDTCFADVNLLNTIFRNLISNAIKFTPNDGSITVGVVNNPTNDTIRIYFKDTGVGMDKITLEKLFRMDETITSIGTAGEKGTGLGLILCKEFVEKHAGKIWAESEVGLGTTFWIELPLK